MRIPIVDEQDNILYYKDSQDRMADEIIRVVGLWITNEKGEVLIARRSKNEKHMPNLWGPSVTGGVEEGETYESNVAKEVEEEIGIILDNFLKGPKKLFFRKHKFFAQWFFTKVPSDTEFVLLKDEVDEVKWVDLSELEDWHKREPELFLPLLQHDLEVLKEYAN